MRHHNDRRPLRDTDQTWRSRLRSAFPLVLVLGLAACGSDTDDLDEGPDPSEEGTEIVPGESGPVD